MLVVKIHSALRQVDQEDVFFDNFGKELNDLFQILEELKIRESVARKSSPKSSPPDRSIFSNK